MHCYEMTSKVLSSWPPIYNATFDWPCTIYLVLLVYYITVYCICFLVKMFCGLASLPPFPEKFSWLPVTT